MSQRSFISSARLGILGAAIACSLVVGCSSSETTGIGAGGAGGGGGGNGGGTPCSGQACMAVELAHVEHRMGRPVLDDDQLYWTGERTKVAVTGSGGDVLLGGVVMSLPASGGQPATLLSTSYIPSWPAVDGTHVYWGQWENESTAGSESFVGRIPRAGGAEAPLPADASNHPVIVAVDATNIYFTTAEGAVMSLPKGGGPAVTLASAQDPVGLLVIDDTSVYWVSNSPPSTPSTGAIKKVAKAGGATVTLASGFQGVLEMAQDDMSIYYATGDMLMKVAKAGGAPVTLVPNASPGGLAVDDINVYFTDWGSTLKVIPKSGGTPTVLVKIEPGADLNMLRSVAVDATSVYWVRTRLSLTAFNYESWLMKMPK